MIDLLLGFVFVHSRQLNCFLEFSIFLNKISSSSSVLFIKLFTFKEHSSISLRKDLSLLSGFMQNIHRQVPHSSGFGFTIYLKGHIWRTVHMKCFPFYLQDIYHVKLSRTITDVAIPFWLSLYQVQQENSDLKAKALQLSPFCLFAYIYVFSQLCLVFKFS